ncbi:MAG: DNA primase noncatalytic subunit PriX [Candidatus Nitrosopolaris sp.]
MPGSFNSKLVQLNQKGEIVNIPESAQVKIVQKWNGVKPRIKPLLSEFYISLADSKIKEIRKNRKPRRHSVHYENNHKIQWIETLLQIPIADHRKYTLWRIVAPYLVNIRKLAYDDAFNIMKNWLNNCNQVRPLNFNANVKIKDALRAAIRVGYLPMAFNDLKSEDGELYRHISNRFGKSWEMYHTNDHN